MSLDVSLWNEHIFSRKMVGTKRHNGEGGKLSTREVLGDKYLDRITFTHGPQVSIPTQKTPKYKLVLALLFFLRGG